MKNTNPTNSDLNEAGLDPSKVDELLERVQIEVDEGLLPSAQIAIARNGKLGLFKTYGDATNESLYCVFSATKGITTAAGWLLIQEGKLDITQKVSEIVPEFGSNNKQDITIEQLFTHTAGFPNASFRPSDWLDKSLRNSRYESWKLSWEPGTRYEYHPTSTMWVIAEIIERITEESFTDFVRNRIALPLGLPDLWVGCPETEHGRIAEIVHSGDALTSEDYAKLGIPEPPVTEVTESALTNFNNSDVRQVGVPGGGGIMSAADLAMFYQGVAGNIPAAGRIWSEETLNFGLEVRTGELKDRLTNTQINRALGLCVAGDKRRNYRGFGHTNSPLAFGHAGAGGQIAWYDPETGISVGYCTNGHDRNGIRQARRSISISNKAAVCAG